MAGPPSNGAPNGRVRLSPTVVNSIAAVVTCVWALSFLADIVVDEYSPPTNVHMAFMLIVGAVFGSQFVRRAD